MNYINTFFQNIYYYAESHNVNPIIFITLYIISFPFYYYPLLRMRKIFKERKKVKLIENIVFKSIIINRLAWASPYLYILIFGRGLSMLVTTLLIIYVLLGIVLFLYKFYKRGKNGNKNC